MSEGVLSRRSFLVGGASAVALLAFGGATIWLGKGNGLLRPPGAADDSLLYGRCIRCERCTMVCPLHAVKSAKVEQGILNVRTPTMDFRAGYCDFCSGHPKCAESCPTECFTSFDPNKDKLGMAVVDTTECLLYSGSSECSKRCIDACNYGALYLDANNLLRVDDEKCNGCGACEFFCPSASYLGFRGSQNRGINIEFWEGATA